LPGYECAAQTSNAQRLLGTVRNISLIKVEPRMSPPGDMGALRIAMR
jgi:hypothetical protein